MKKLIILIALILPFALSTQIQNRKKYIVEFRSSKRIYCDSFYLHTDAYLIDVIDYKEGYLKITTYKSIVVKNLFAVSDTLSIE